VDWREFIRVETSKFLLAVLVVVLIVKHAPEYYTGAALGALLILIEGRRYGRRS
jgi:hypothetical protein